MRRNISFIDEYAVSEVVGAMILILVAIVVFAVIYTYVFPLPIPPPEPNVKLMGYVNDDGLIVIEHMGGEPVSSYEIYGDGELIYQNDEEPWVIGKCIYPSLDKLLVIEEDQVLVTVFRIYEGNRQMIFDGILTGKGGGTPPSPPSGPLMLISSLRTNTTDEDLICFNYTIEPDIDALTYIYNWSVDGNSIMNLLMPFDTDSSNVVKDYSGNENNGAVSGPVWTSEGTIGGAYSFDGVDDYISLPYCFDSSYIDKLTVETWIKTQEDSASIISFNRTNYWELGINNGKITWSTKADDGTTDTISVLDINDGDWHHVAATYDSFTGDCSIYINGTLDRNENGHNPGEVLGSGDNPSGFIGHGTGAGRETIFSTSFETQEEKNNWKEDNDTWGGGGGTEVWDTLYEDDFEWWWGGTWGDWNDGGGDCYLDTGGTYARSGIATIHLRDNSGWSSSTYCDKIHAQSSGYAKMSLDFWWQAISFEPSEDFYVSYYDGSSLHDIDSYVVAPGQYSNGEYYHTVVTIDALQYPFTDRARFVIQCDASDNGDHLYIDDVYVNVTIGNRVDYDFDLRDSTELDPHTGNYSIGGTGDFDPDFAYFNRTKIDISEYTEVKLSVWYSYDSTESADEMGLYYKDGENWIPIFEELEPQIGNGNQLDWTYVDVQIPEYIDDLEFQFMWSTSSTSEYVAIDDLEITGIPPGVNNYTGLVDELRIYNRVLSSEQIYQNYLCTKDGFSDKSVIVSEETALNNIWKCTVTPNDGIQDDVAVESNTLKIVNYDGGE